MQHGLAVEADNLDRSLVDTLGLQEGFDGLGLDAGHEFVGFGQHAGPRHAVGQASARGERPAQEIALGFRIGPVAGRPEALDGLAIGLKQRHIDPVERGPTHQSDCPHYAPAPPPLRPVS